MTLAHHFRAETRLPLQIEAVFEFFSNAENLQRITPDFLHFEFLTPLPIAMGVGTRIDYRIRLSGIPMRWRTHITQWDPPRRFVDDQERGPYAQWTHTHRFRSEGGDTIIEDEVVYRLPFGVLGLVALPMVRRRVAQIFAYRERAIREALNFV